MWQLSASAVVEDAASRPARIVCVCYYKCVTRVRFTMVLYCTVVQSPRAALDPTAMPSPIGAAPEARRLGGDD